MKTGNSDARRVGAMDPSQNRDAHGKPMESKASIAALATRQRGVVTAEQLYAAGLSRATVKRRLRAGSLRRVHRNVYLVGHAAAPEGATEMAATLACGDDSVISHRSAARLWKLSSLMAWDGPVEVTVPGRHVEIGRAHV